MSKHPQNISLYVEVLQNGQCIAEYSRPLSKHGSVILGAKKSAHLRVPLYSFRHSYKIARVEKKGVRIQVDPGTEGFANTGGAVMHFNPLDKTQRIINLHHNDHASISFDDLTILLKIAPAIASEKTRRLIGSGFRGSIIRSALGDRNLRNAFLLALLGAVICFSGIIYGFAVRHDDRPRQFSQLPAEFSLKFIHPDHLRHAPEALQANLNRADLIGSVTNYYDSLSATVIDVPAPASSLLLPTTSSVWQSVHQEKNDHIENLLAEAKTKLESLSSKTKANTAVVSIPVHLGESLLEQRQRLLGKHAVLHRALAANLKEKRQVIAAFNSDQPYDFADYKNTAPVATPNKTAQAELAKIKVFKFTTDEEAMYLEAETAAKRAAELQGRELAPIQLVAATELPTVVTIDKELASYLPLQDPALLDEKLKDLRASELGQRAAKTNAEPLIGQLDPKLIESVISKNRFQLQLCFELALRRNREARGDMEWIWRVDTKGKISDLNLVSSSINDKQMVDCVRKKIAAWQFPRPRQGSIEVRYPFSFSPAKG